MSKNSLNPATGGRLAAARGATAAARQARLQRFADEVDPERVLPEHVRERRAKALRAEQLRATLERARWVREDRLRERAAKAEGA